MMHQCREVPVLGRGGGAHGTHIVLDKLDGVGRIYFAFAVVVDLARRPLPALRIFVDRLVAASFHLLVDLICSQNSQL